MAPGDFRALGARIGVSRRAGARSVNASAEKP
jgi:hypothetical protein